MPLTFDWILQEGEVGWATLSLSNGESTFQAEIEYESNPLAEIAEYAVHMCRGWVNTTIIIFRPSCQGYAINLFRDGEWLDFRVRDLADATDAIQMQSGPILFEGRDLTKTFAVQVTLALDRLWRKHGYFDYVRRWYMAEFPLCEYLRLRMLLDRSPLVHQIADALRQGNGAPELELELLRSPCDLTEEGSGLTLAISPLEDDSEFE